MSEQPHLEADPVGLRTRIRPQDAPRRADRASETRLAAVDARFDALRPPRLRVRVRVRSYAPGEFAVSDAGRPARRPLAHLRQQTSPLPRVLRAIEAAVCDLVTELYGAEVAGWFRREHLLGLLSLDRFDAAEGFNVCVLVPRSG